MSFRGFEAMLRQLQSCRVRNGGLEGFELRGFGGVSGSWGSEL